ncbi:MAG: hypothetical protein AB1714_07650 [Acidobacteriota bacterium]
MTAIRVVFDEQLLALLDRDPAVQRDGRSAVLRRAAAEYLRLSRARRVDREYERAYRDASGVAPEFAGWEDESSWPGN